MTRTTWLITDKKNETITTKLDYYHLGKEPKFPSWYMEKGHIYTIKMVFNYELIKTPISFLKCLTHCYEIKSNFNKLMDDIY